MKKNFLMVASLLIAAMLMVVSCSQEVTPKNDGLVEARLNVAYGRELDVEDVTDANGLKLKYTMENQWTDQASNKTDKVYGAVTDEELPADGKLGWVSQGYWTVTVKAYKDTTVVFEGSTSIYFNSKNSNATVYLAPKGSNTTNNSITFDFYMQDIGPTYGTDFDVRYTITKNGEALKDHNGVAFTSDQAKQVYKAETETGVTTTAPENAVYDHQRNYKKTINGLSSGYYTVTVSVYEKVTENNKDTMKLKGGISKGFLLADNDAKVTGHVEPSEYVGTVLKTYYVDVDTTLSNPTITYTKNEAGKNTSATITLTLTDGTVVNKYNSNLATNEFTKSYFWSVDGAEFAAESSSTPLTKTVDVRKAGVYHIACRTIYSLTAGGTTYYWAETQEKSVQITDIIY